MGATGLYRVLYRWQFVPPVHFLYPIKVSYLILFLSSLVNAGFALFLLLSVRVLLFSCFFDVVPPSPMGLYGVYI